MADGVRLFEEESKTASKEVIRNFVRELSDLTDKVKLARDEKNKIIKENDEVQKIDDEMKRLRQERKEYIESHPMISSYEAALQDVIEERKQLIDDAKQDGVPRGEIDLAIKALKKDLDITIATDIYANIADLVRMD